MASRYIKITLKEFVDIKAAADDAISGSGASIGCEMTDDLINDTKKASRAIRRVCERNNLDLVVYAE